MRAQTPVELPLRFPEGSILFLVHHLTMKTEVVETPKLLNPAGESVCLDSRMQNAQFPVPLRRVEGKPCEAGLREKSRSLGSYLDRTLKTETTQFQTTGIGRSDRAL